MAFHYHYCLTIPHGQLGRSPVVIDGVSIMQDRVTTLDEYRHLKAVICGSDFDPKTATLTSLTLLHETQNGNYDPILSQAGFMDLVCTLQAQLKTSDSFKILGAMPQAQRDAALRLEAAAKNYVEVVEGR